MNISKELILRLAADAGLDEEGAVKLRRDLELCEELIGQRVDLTRFGSTLPNIRIISEDGKFVPEAPRVDQQHDVIGQLSPASQDKFYGSGHGYASS